MGIVQSVKAFVGTVYGQLASIAAAVGVLWGLFKALGALKAWIIKTKWYQARKARREAPQKILEETQRMSTRIGEIQNRFTELSHDVSHVQQDVTTIQQDVTTIQGRLEVNNECTSTVMLQKMMFAYHHYYLQGNPIPLDVRTALEEMFDQYKSSNPAHNHVPDDFKVRIASCTIVGQSTVM